ncbi:hypothetical protein GS870_24445 [Rhodococcus hoagii]|nr:hypothetical protein [Prescottella equi]
MTITVADTGPGLARGTHEQVFDAFQRLGDRDNTVGVGPRAVGGQGVRRGDGRHGRGDRHPGGGLTMIVELDAAPAGAGEVEGAR